MIIITIILNIIGIIFILVSLIFLNKFSSREKDIDIIYEDILKKHSDIKIYYNEIDNIIDNFNEVLYMSLNKMEDIGENTKKPNNTLPFKGIEVNKHINKNLAITSDEIEDKKLIYKEILEMKRMGLSTKEIAQKLNKGVREVEIIIKMLENV